MTLWSDLFLLMAAYSVLVPVGVTLYRYRRLGAATRILAIYVCLDGLHQILLSVAGTPNAWMLQSWLPIEFTCIAWFYSRVLQGIKGVAVLGLLLLTVLHSDSGNTGAILEGVLVLGFGLNWCYKTLAELKIRYLEQDPVFWINTGFLLYFSGAVLLGLTSSYLSGLNCSQLFYLSAMHALFIIVKNCFVSIGLWKDK